MLFVKYISDAWRRSPQHRLRHDAHRVRVALCPAENAGDQCLSRPARERDRARGQRSANHRRDLHKRAGWSVKQQRFAGYAPPITAPREYVSGESYRYLGRQYRLKVFDGIPETLALGRTDLFVTARDKDPERVRRLLERWYRAEARPRLR